MVYREGNTHDAQRKKQDQGINIRATSKDMSGIKNRKKLTKLERAESNGFAHAVFFIY